MAQDKEITNNLGTGVNLEIKRNDRLLSFSSQSFYDIEGHLKQWRIVPIDRHVNVQ